IDEDDARRGSNGNACGAVYRSTGRLCACELRLPGWDVVGEIVALRRNVVALVAGQLDDPARESAQLVQREQSPHAQSRHERAARRLQIRCGAQCARDVCLQLVERSPKRAGEQLHAHALGTIAKRIATARQRLTWRLLASVGRIAGAVRRSRRWESFSDDTGI